LPHLHRLVEAVSPGWGTDDPFVRHIELVIAGLERALPSQPTRPRSARGRSRDGP
jgi:hypothetical protein